MRITERQKQIFDGIIGEYINSAKAVGSKELEKIYDFGISPATIRIEMQKLTEAGLIEQPHSSAGRVPTDKGYRFFVNELLSEEHFPESLEMRDWLEFAAETEDAMKIIQVLTKKLSLFSSDLILGYLPEQEILWKEGWEEVLREPEFKKTGYVLDFAELLKDLEKNIGRLKVGSEVKIFIGRENPFSKKQDFSFIFSQCSLPLNKKGVLAILGPKRMPYFENISLLNSVSQLFNYV